MENDGYNGFVTTPCFIEKARDTRKAGVVGIAADASGINVI